MDSPKLLGELNYTFYTMDQVLDFYWTGNFLARL